jgi:hypothetical protein
MCTDCWCVGACVYFVDIDVDASTCVMHAASHLLILSLRSNSHLGTHAPAAQAWDVPRNRVDVMSMHTTNEATDDDGDEGSLTDRSIPRQQEREDEGYSLFMSSPDHDRHSDDPLESLTLSSSGEHEEHAQPSGPSHERHTSLDPAKHSLFVGEDKEEPEALLSLSES